MPKALNLSGKVFNWLTVLEPVRKENEPGICWRCRCKCGNITITKSYPLVKGITKSCGCYSHKYLQKIRRVDLTNKTFDRWTVIKRSKRRLSNTRDYLWWCICSCGVIKEVRQLTLRNGTSRSCGCLTIERSQKHGLWNKSYLWTKWSAMISRCYCKSNISYKNYGGRGIAVCNEWKEDFLTFYHYIKENLGDRPTKQHSLDRINNDSNYEPGNVKWSTPFEQAQNRRTNKNKLNIINEQ